MPNAEPHRLFATDIVRLIEGGGLTAEAVVASCLERIAVREPVVRAWAYLAGAASLERARAFDQAGKKALLGGVPFGLKDIFDAAQMPATYGSPIYTGWWPPSDASAAALPKAAGGILLGKTISTEFANRQPGPTSNPHDPAFSPGGSSSGSAAAVADFMVPLAIGTQTGGSVIRPAAYCGVVGFKPSFGLFPPAGMRINTETLDTVGIMARSVADIALFRAAMMAIPYEPPAMPETPPRLGLCRGPHWDDAQPEGRAVLETAADRLAAAGAKSTDTALPPECADGRRDPADPRRVRRAAQPHARILSARSLAEPAAARRENRARPPADPRPVPQRVPRGREGPRRGTRMGRGLRRDPDFAGSRPGAARARRYRIGGVQRAVDAIRHALPDLACRT